MKIKNQKSKKGVSYNENINFSIIKAVEKQLKLKIK